MITTRGAGFLAAAVALFFLARLTQVGWVYLLDSVLWGALLLSAVMPRLTTLFLAAQRSLPPPGVSGAKAWPSDGGQIDIQVTLRNRVFWPRFLLNLDYRCPPAQPQRVRLFVAKLNGSQRARLTSTIDLHQRGNHLLGPVFAESSAPFGLFRRRCELTPAEPLLVYPMVHTLARLPVADALSEAAAQSKRSRSGLEPAGARRYVSGDPRRNIPWRNTARVGQPMVKEFDDPSQNTLHLVFDATQVWGEGSETTLEYAIKIVASAAFYANSIRVPVHIFGGGIQHSSHGVPDGGLPWPELLRQLALVEPGDGDDLSKTLGGLPRGSNVVVAAGLSSAPAMRSLLSSAAFHQPMVVVGLEGFGEPEPTMGAVGLESLRLAGAAIVSCRKGQLTMALDALSKVDTDQISSKNRPARFTVPQNASGTLGG